MSIDRIRDVQQMAAAAVVSVSMGVMKPVLDKLTTLMGEEYKKIKGLRKEVTFLRRELSEMDVFLENMDLVDELNPQDKKWRKDVIEMSYDIEDRIDDFMHHVGEKDNKMGILRKASQFLRTFKYRRRIANEFQDIKTRVMEASERRKRYTPNQCISVTTPVVVDPRVSALYKDTKSLVGIDVQKDELVNWAMDKEQPLKFMAISGFGGLGKMTLANVVYHEVGGQFSAKAFVSVSQKPNMIGLLNSFLSQLGLGTYSDGSQMHNLIDKLRGHLQDKRYFIVVDDLWDIQAWDAIKCGFPQNSQFSRVIITTRDENVARYSCGNHGWIYSMKRLSVSNSRELFFNRIFGSEDACPPQLVEPSCKILKKCDGLPLAIITMASMLACQQTRSEGQWDRSPSITH
ncbi:hypothetical protein U9M48_041297 [Paspalum notatum var. saurae]|uniref:Uncharacterized protein n=2 Tax=Paspalum notatum var. saurae TaxID=547442 RepID=A0AAQ3XGE0_PASNO